MKTTLDTQTVGWIPYDQQGSTHYVPISNWGKDHWSTFLYLESRAVDHKGIVDNEKMRCNPRLHRPFAHNLIGMSNMAGMGDGSKYPTRLAKGTMENHDDWSCAEDMVAAGLIKIWWTEPPPEQKESMFGFAKAKIELTDRGWTIAARLRRHLADGGHTYANFQAS